MKLLVVTNDHLANANVKEKSLFLTTVQDLPLRLANGEREELIHRHFRDMDLAE